MSKRNLNKKNVTVWLDISAIRTLDDLAKETCRSRNYVISRILEQFTANRPNIRKRILTYLGCLELAGKSGK